jgi:outer membrane protein TolC
VILSVQEAYFVYIALGALIKAQEATLEEATANFDAAEERRRLGVATIADVLQAKTQRSRAQLQLETSRGRRDAVRGAVLTSVGLPPTLRVDVEEIEPDAVSITELTADVETLLAEMKAHNPAIQAAAARVESSNALADAVSRSRWPRISATALGEQMRRDGDWSDEYTVGAAITFPLFTGFSLPAQAERARLQAETARASLERTVQDQALQVWTEFTNTKTAETQITVSRDLLTSATQNLEVAQGRYREGLGSILDVLEAQRSVQEARSSVIEAYTHWYLSVARLRFEIGSVRPDGAIVGDP